MLNERYGTTSLLTKEKSEIVNNPRDKFETVLFLPVGEDRKGEGGLRTKGYFRKSFKDKPLITIVTVVFNGEKYLEETIQSVINQTYDNIEYIIIDGGSTDVTLDIIKKYEDRIDYWVSEPDKGIYYAMNKGVNLATGDWANLLNSGDKFYNNKVLSSVGFDKIIEDIVFGKAIIYYKDLSFIRYANFNLKDKEWYLSKIPNHQCVFVSSRVYKAVLYDVNYKYCADSVYLKKIFSIFSCHETGKLISRFELGGVSNVYGTFKRYKDVTLDHIIMTKGVMRPIIVNSIKFIAQKILGTDNYLKFYIKYIVKK